LHVLKSTNLLFPIEDVGRGAELLVPTFLRVLLPQHQQTVGVAERERLQHDGVDGGENRRIRANA
jgi:hypothetical protein